jgi:thiamine-phosphate pyrophosphorylase
MPEDLSARLRLIVVTDPDAGSGRETLDVVRAALRAGAPAIQLRWKEASAREMVALAAAIRETVVRTGALLLVNDRVDVALAAGANGAHLGDDDLPVEAARRIAPPGFLLGVSADTPERARRGVAEGADYVGTGPVYATGSKRDAGEPVGAEQIRRVAAAVPVPVVGIGGIGPGGAGDVVRAGAAGVAVISAVMRAADPEAVVRMLLREVEDGRRAEAPGRLA